METFKKGWWWYKNHDFDGEEFIDYFEFKEQLYPEIELLQYLGKDYEEFLGRFKIKAS